MMATYQQNELVELEKLRETAQKYDSLITVLEKKTKSIR
jgi:hypothetical protein